MTLSDQMESAPSLHILVPSPEPSSREGRKEPKAEERLEFLGELEDILRQVVGLEGRLWLCSAFEALSVPHKVYGPVFLELLRRATRFLKRSPSERGEDDEVAVVRQVLRMLCENCPRRVAHLLMNDSAMLRHFFSGQSKRVRQWFQTFAPTGTTDHQFGARALARYTFTHRETAWHELVWKEDRSQAPATVAAKPHYFAELDVIETIENFLDHLPEFWSSEELRESLEDGGFLSLDMDYFIRELLEKMESNEGSNVWRLVKDYLAEESFAVLCKRILPIAKDYSLLQFVNELGVAMAKWRSSRLSECERAERAESATGLTSSFPKNSWLESAVAQGVEWKTLNAVIFGNACVGHGRELARLLKDEKEEEAEQLKSLLSSRDACNELEHWKVRNECLLVQKWKSLTWLALEAWLLFHLLTRDSTRPEALERLLTEIGVGFVRSGGEVLSKDADNADGKRDRMESRRSKRKRKIKKKHRWKSGEKAREQYYSSEDDRNNSDSDLPFATTDNFPNSTLSWRLSADDYAITWTKVDVCEYLADHALRRWLQWTVLRW